MSATQSKKGGKIQPPTGPSDRVLFIDNNSIDFTQPFELLTVAETAELLKLSVPSVRRLQQERRIPFFKVRGNIRFARSDLAVYLEKCRVKSVGQ